MSTGITVGKVVGGAAMAAGAILLLSAVMPEGSLDKVMNKLGDFFEGLKNTLFGASTPTTPSEPGFWENLVSGKYPRLSAGIGGAAVLGGGMALKGHMDNIETSSIDAKEQAQLAEQDNERYAKMIEIKRMQGEMKAKMALASPEFVQAQAPVRA